MSRSLVPDGSRLVLSDESVAPGSRGDESLMLKVC